MLPSSAGFGEKRVQCRADLHWPLFWGSWAVAVFSSSAVAESCEKQSGLQLFLPTKRLVEDSVKVNFAFELENAIGDVLSQLCVLRSEHLVERRRDEKAD